METLVQWNAGMSSACVCWAARKMIRLPCLCVHRNMNVITPPYPISRVVVCTCDRGIAGVYMWPSFSVRRWPHLCVHVTVGSLVCTCDRRFACAGDRKARKRSLCVHVTWICVRGWPLDHTPSVSIYTIHGSYESYGYMRWTGLNSPVNDFKRTYIRWGWPRTWVAGFAWTPFKRFQWTPTAPRCPTDVNVGLEPPSQRYCN